MKMAFLISSVSRQAGGVHASVCRLGQSLGDAGAVQLQVLGLRDEHTDEDIGHWSPLPTRAFPVRGPRQFGYAPQLKRALFDLDFDIVLNHGLWMYPSVAALAWHRRTRRPFIANPHGMLDEWAVKHSRWKKRLAGLLYENPTLQRAACIRALCRAEARSIRAYGLRNPICVIPNGIDLIPATPPPWAGQIEPGRKVMLYLGRLHPKKGLSNVLRAWAQVAAEEPDTEPNIPQHRMVVCMSRPGMRLSHGRRPSNISSLSLVRNRISPIQMNKGNAASSQLALLSQKAENRLLPGEVVVKKA